MQIYTDSLNKFFESQFLNWELARVNYNQLGSVRTRSIDFGSFGILVQFNPERMRSSAAKVDARSINERPCFLCAQNRPPEQEEIRFGDDLEILVNPFPIFGRHLTIPSVGHRLQRIIPDIGSMLKLSEALPGYVVFYNGPQCGASAPDHFHFQAGNRGILPIERDIANPGNKISFLSKPDIEILLWKDYYRSLVTFRSDNKESIEEYFIRFYNAFAEIQADKPEPMLNILSLHDSDTWTIHIFPRRLHRPAQYFLEGDARILLSPASVDLAGLIITPREEDFTKLTGSDIKDIFSQVCLGDEELKMILDKMI
jgi:hypothetical protein